jgi:hexosaminidase
MVEFDMPGHASSWCAGYPEICPSKTCNQPLNPANNLTFTLIDSLLGECTGNAAGAGLFPYSLLHLGADEVEFKCWQESAEITAWEAKNGFKNGARDTYEYFVAKAAEIAVRQKIFRLKYLNILAEN